MTVDEKSPHVLVADDVMATTIMLQRLFEIEGYRVTSVHNGVEALEAARSLLPDLLLLDIDMPYMNGFEVLRQLRETPVTANIPTIIITASGEWPSAVQGLQLGADDYVRKPFHPRELLARAESKMHARRLEDTLQRRTQDLEALLRASEALNQNLDIDQLLEIIIFLTQDLLPGQCTMAYQVSADGELLGYRFATSSPDVSFLPDHLDHRGVLQWAQRQPYHTWNAAHDSLLGAEFPHGILIPLRYSDSEAISGILVTAGDHPYDGSHLQLMQGIARQANLALRNAELYQLKANYASSLEEQVQIRTAELQSAQEMLVRSEKLASIGRLASSVAHEINNPLMPITFNLELMIEDLNEGGQIEPEFIEKTLESVYRIKRIVQRLLDFTRHGSRQTQEIEALDLNAVIQSVVELVEKSFSRDDKRIELDLTPLPEIQGNRDGLEQVLLNLTINAGHAIDRGGVVKFKTLAEGSDLIITIADSGHGISPEIIDHIFEPFVTTKKEGSGLGLYVSYGIIQSHGGSISVESKPEQGSTFTIRLPMSGAADREISGW
jgi:signal transduction histidine kinase/CheY-like chemotaxis protein